MGKILFNPLHLEITEDLSFLEEYFEDISNEKPSNLKDVIIINNTDLLDEYKDYKIIFYSDQKNECNIEQLLDCDIIYMSKEFLSCKFSRQYLDRFLEKESSIHLHDGESKEIEKSNVESFKIIDKNIFGYYQDLFMKNVQACNIKGQDALIIFSKFIQLFVEMEESKKAQFPLEIDTIVGEDYFILQGHIPLLNSDLAFNGKTLKDLKESVSMLDFYELRASNKMVCSILWDKKIINNYFCFHEIEHFTKTENVPLITTSLDHENFRVKEKKYIEEVIRESKHFKELEEEIDSAIYISMIDKVSGDLVFEMDHLSETIPEEVDVDSILSNINKLIGGFLNEQGLSHKDTSLDQELILSLLHSFLSKKENEEYISINERSYRKLADDNLRLKLMLEKKEQLINRLSTEGDNSFSLDKARELLERSKMAILAQQRKFDELKNNKVISSQETFNITNDIDRSEAIDKAELVRNIEESFQFKLNKSEKIIESLKQAQSELKKDRVELQAKIVELEKEYKGLGSSSNESSELSSNDNVDVNSPSALEMNVLSESLRKQEDKNKHLEQKVQFLQKQNNNFMTEVAKLKSLTKKGGVGSDVKIRQLELVNKKLSEASSKATKDLANKRKEAHQYKTELSQLKHKFKQLERKLKNAA